MKKYIFATTAILVSLNSTSAFSYGTTYWKDAGAHQGRALPASMRDGSKSTFSTTSQTQTYTQKSTIQQPQQQQFIAAPVAEPIAEPVQQIEQIDTVQTKATLNPQPYQNLATSYGLYQQQPIMQQAAPMPITPPSPNFVEKDLSQPIDDGSPYALGINGGSTGVGAEISARLNDYFSLRAGPSVLQYSGSKTLSDVDYDYDINFFDISTLVDYHPFKSGFRVSAGGSYNDNSIDILATPAAGASVNIGGVQYSGSQLGTIDGNIETGEFSPYAGIGYSRKWSEGSGLYVESDAGVKFNSVTSTLTANGPIASDPTFQANLQKERSQLEDGLKYLEYYPVARIGLGYRF